MSNGASVPELDKFICKLKDPAFRREFHHDCNSALANNDIVAENIPPGVLEMFCQFDLTGLKMVSELNTTLWEAGYRAEGATCVSIV